MPDVSENYSSLREAVNRILGQPAGGNTQGQGFDLAPKLSFSSDLGNIGTSAEVTNTPYDPYAEQSAALAAVKAENAALASQQAAPAAAVAAAPAVASVVSKEPAMISRADLWNKQVEGQKKSYMDSFNQQLANLKATGAYRPDQLAFKTPDLNFKQPNWGSMGGQMVSNPYAVKQAAAAPVAPTQAQGAAPVNPGPRASWQASQQYWKDLAAYNKR